MSKAERDVEAGGAVSAEALLRRIFDIVSEEAARNPQLMTRLTQAIAEAGRIEPPAAAAKAPAPKRTAKKAAKDEPEDELSGVNPIAVLAEEGADALRDRLRFVRRKEPFARMARRYALDVPAAVRRKKASLPETIDAVIEASARRAREQELSGG